MYSKLKLNTCIIVQKNIANIIILTCFLFTGCSLAIPEPDETNQTLLIIPVESRQTLGKFIWTLHVSIEDSSIPSDTLYSKKSEGVTFSGNEYMKSYPLILATNCTSDPI